MTIISILIGLAMEYFIGPLDRVRNFDWFDKYIQWLELKLNKYGFWNGSVGVLITLAVPLSLLLILAAILHSNSIILSFLLATFIFLYSLGPEINGLLNQYIDALEEGDADRTSRIEQLLTGTGENDSRDEANLIKTIFIRANQYIFGVIFWFIVLGMAGALLYCLTLKMKTKYDEIHGSYADAVRDLHKILIWPSARLLALGFALGGSLVDAFEGWRDVQGHSLDCSEEVIGNCGLGGLQYQAVDSENEEEIRSLSVSTIQEVQALINRTLIIWLTLIGLLTLGGWLH